MLIGLFGGFYIVPLYALIQERSEVTHRSRIIAANNILNAVFMVASAGIAIGLLAAGVSIPGLFLVTGILNAVIAFYIYTLVPEFLMRFLAWLLIHTMYRVRKEGLEHVPEEGPCIIVCNHVSYVDAIVIAASVRRPIRFIMDHRIFRIPLLNWLFRTMNAIPVASGKEDAALKEAAFARAAAALRAGEIVGDLSRRALDRDRRDGSLPPRPRAHVAGHAGAGGADGIARTLGQLLQPLAPGQGDAPLAWRVLAHRAGGGRAGAAGGREARRPGSAGARLARRPALEDERVTRTRGSQR